MTNKTNIGWYVAKVKCRICGKSHIACYPEDVIDEECLQCSNCGHKTCQPIGHKYKIIPNNKKQKDKKLNYCFYGINNN